MAPTIVGVWASRVGSARGVTPARPPAAGFEESEVVEQPAGTTLGWGNRRVVSPAPEGAPAAVGGGTCFRGSAAGTAVPPNISWGGRAAGGSAEDPGGPPKKTHSGHRSSPQGMPCGGRQSLYRSWEGNSSKRRLYK